MTRRALSNVTPPKTVATADLAPHLTHLRYAARVLLDEAGRCDDRFEPAQAEQHREVVVGLHKLHELIVDHLGVGEA